MAIMGLETPVEMPSMNVYNTDLMKMYIAGLKEQYDNAREEMKDFMKSYGDFYSPVPGATEAYNNMTIGGARDLLNQMFANGIDPYKNPQARQMISKYVANVPIGSLKLLELQKEDYNKYQDAVRAAIANGTYNAPMELYYLQKEGLDNFRAMSPEGSINRWTRMAPSRFVTLEEITNPFFKNLEKTDYVGADKNHPGYSLYKVADQRLAEALTGGVKAVLDHPSGDYYVYRAEQELKAKGIDRRTNPYDFDRLLLQLLAADVQHANAESWLTKSEYDRYAEQMRNFAHAERMELKRHNNAMRENAVGGKYDPNSGISLTNNLIMSGTKMTTQKTGTANVAKGQSLLLQSYLSGVRSGGKNPSAKGFLDFAFKQELNPSAATSLATNGAAKTANINYRPGRDGGRIKTYEELADETVKGTGYSYSFNARNNPSYLSVQTNSNLITSALDKAYDPTDPKKVQIVNNGGAYSILESDGYYHTYSPATVVVYGDVDENNNRKVEYKQNVVYEFAVPISSRTGETGVQRTAEGVLSDQKTTQLYGIKGNSGNSTVYLGGSE